MNHYGETDAEKLASEKLTCRKIVSEISQFGVSQRQMMFIIYLMATELEDVHVMQELTAAIRELANEDLFIVDRSAETVQPQVVT